MKYWVIERNNPQLNKPYYYALGKVAAKVARARENTRYGYNIAISFSSKAKYDEFLNAKTDSGFDVKYC